MSEHIQVKIKKLHPDAVIPKYSHDGDVCMDVTAIGLEYDAEHDMYIYHTGLAFESEFNVGQFLYLRSSNCKTDAYLCNGVGIADSAIYRGEIQFRMKNRVPTREILRNRDISKMCEQVVEEQVTPNAKIEFFLNNLSGILNNKIVPTHEELVKTALELAPYKVGDRVGQMVFMQYPTVELVEADELSDSSRGSGGFGSTGK